MKKKVYEKDIYVKGLLAAEQLFKEGYYFAGERPVKVLSGLQPHTRAGTGMTLIITNISTT